MVTSHRSCTPIEGKLTRYYMHLPHEFDSQFETVIWQCGSNSERKKKADDHRINQACEGNSAYNMSHKSS